MAPCYDETILQNIHDVLRTMSAIPSGTIQVSESWKLVRSFVGLIADHCSFQEPCVFDLSSPAIAVRVWLVNLYHACTVSVKVSVVLRMIFHCSSVKDVMVFRDPLEFKLTRASVRVGRYPRLVVVAQGSDSGWQRPM